MYLKDIKFNISLFIIDLWASPSILNGLINQESGSAKSPLKVEMLPRSVGSRKHYLPLSATLESLLMNMNYASKYRKKKKG